MVLPGYHHNISSSHLIIVLPGYHHNISSSHLIISISAHTPPHSVGPKHKAMLDLAHPFFGPLAYDFIVARLFFLNRVPQHLWPILNSFLSAGYPYELLDRQRGFLDGLIQ